MVADMPIQGCMNKLLDMLRKPPKSPAVANPEDDDGLSSYLDSQPFELIRHFFQRSAFKHHRGKVYLKDSTPSLLAYKSGRFSLPHVLDCHLQMPQTSEIRNLTHHHSVTLTEPLATELLKIRVVTLG